MPASRQVGLSGRIVKPELYIAFGISGAIQHRVGMNGAERIIAVNSDPSAPIHGFADLSILTDAGSVLRSLDSSLRSLRAGYSAGEDLLHMAGDLDVAPEGFDPAVLPHDEGGADGADGLGINDVFLFAVQIKQRIAQILVVCADAAGTEI